MSDEIKKNQPLESAETVRRKDQASRNLDSIGEAGDQKTWTDTQKAHKLGDDGSATHIVMTPEAIAELQEQGLAEKFEIVGLDDDDDPGESTGPESKPAGLRFFEEKARKAIGAIRDSLSAAAVPSGDDLIAQLPSSGDVVTDATNATRSEVSPLNLDKSEQFAQETAKRFVGMLKDTGDPKHRRALEYLSGAMQEVESADGSPSRKAAAESQVLSYICGELKLPEWHQGESQVGALDRVTIGPTEFRLPGETIKVDTTGTCFHENQKAQTIVSFLDGNNKFLSGRASNMALQELNSIEDDGHILPDSKAGKEADFVELLRANMGPTVSRQEASNHCEIVLSRPGKPSLSMDISDTALNNYRFPDGVSVQYEPSTGTEKTSTSTGEIFSRSRNASGEIVYTHTNELMPETNYTLGLRSDGSAWYQEIGKDPVEISKEQGEQDWRVQRVKLEQLASEKIPSLRDRYQFLADMRELERRYPPEYMKLSPEQGHVEIAGTFAQIARLLEGKEGSTPDCLPAGKPDEVPWRVLIAEQVMHHAADPTSCDQGPQCVCPFESLQDRQYTRTPSVVAKLVADIALDNRYQPRGSGDTVSLTADTLAPDPDAASYKVRKGGAAARSYAGQLYDDVVVNLAFEFQKQELAEFGFGNAHYERRKDAKGKFDYFIVENGPNGRVLSRYNDAFRANKIPTYSALVDINETMLGTREVAFFLEGSSVVKPGISPKEARQREEFYELSWLGKGLHIIHSSNELGAELLRLKSEGNWPPIVSMNSHVEPVLSQFIRSFGSPPAPLKHGEKPGGHTEVVSEIAGDGNLASLDNHWGKRGDNTAAPSISTERIGQAMLDDTPPLPTGFDKIFGTFKSFVDSSPVTWASMKKSWVSDLPVWAKEHAQEISRGDPSDWMKKHPHDGFVQAYIKEHGKDDPQLLKWIADANELLKRYPS